MNSHLKIAWRNLYREKSYALINIAGLALAVCACLIVTLYLRNELSYDQHHPEYQKTYRVVNEINVNGSLSAMPFTSWLLGPLLKQNYPEVVDYVRFVRIPGRTGRNLLRYEDQVFYWDNVYATDESVFRLFQHEVIYGDPAKTLLDADSIAVSQRFARTYFGDENPIGKILTTDSGSARRIDLVFADLADNSHLKYDLLFSLKRDIWRTPENINARRQNLFNLNTYTYLVMADNYSSADFGRLGEEFYAKFMDGFLQQVAGVPATTDLGQVWRPWLQAMADVHFQTEVGEDLPTGNRIYLYGFAAVGLFILLVACINYVNLATARATKRAKTVGMRKILGANRGGLMLQFMGEAVFFTLIAALLGIVLTELVLTLSPLNSLIGKQLSLNLSEDPALLFWVFGISLFVGLLSGLYPALYLSSWAPLAAMVGRNRGSKASAHFRQGLVFLQFSISVAVIAATLLMVAQMHYVKEKSLGFDPENRVIVTLHGVDLIAKAEDIGRELSRDPHVLGFATTDSIMGQPIDLGGRVVQGDDGSVQGMLMNMMRVDERFLNVMGIELAQGRDFSQKLLTDLSGGALVNESLVKKMGWENPLDKFIDPTGNDQRLKVIGVVKDFNFESLHNPIGPLAIYPFNDDFSQLNEMQRRLTQRFMIINVAGQNIRQTLQSIEAKFAEVDPNHPFEFQFLDQSLDNQYRAEKQVMSLIGIFATLCILIACMGLFGLAVFTTEQRTKEIGVRKTLGATTSQIILLLSRNIFALVIGGALLASVIAYLAIDEWLAGFAYRAPINPMIFVIATLVTALVAYITIALQSYRTASADPVGSLRYE